MDDLIEVAEKRVAEEKREKAILLLERQLKIVEEDRETCRNSIARLAHLETLTIDELCSEWQSINSLGE